MTQVALITIGIVAIFAVFLGVAWATWLRHQERLATLRRKADLEIKADATWESIQKEWRNEA